MSVRKSVALFAAASVAVLALGAGIVTAAGPGQVVKVKSEITIGAVGYQGKVKSKNSNCIGERIVVLKQKGRGVISRSKSKPNGNWKANLDELNAKIKIPAKVFAEVRPITQATAGPIYRCLAATSRTVEIAGG